MNVKISLGDNQVSDDVKSNMEIRTIVHKLMLQKDRELVNLVDTGALK